MKKVELKISEEKARELYKTASSEFKVLLEETFSKETLIKPSYPTTTGELHCGKQRFLINEDSMVARSTKSVISNRNENLLSSEKRAEAFLALMQLVEYRDAWNGVDG